MMLSLLNATNKSNSICFKQLLTLDPVLYYGAISSELLIDETAFIFLVLYYLWNTSVITETAVLIRFSFEYVAIIVLTKCPQKGWRVFGTKSWAGLDSPLHFTTSGKFAMAQKII